VRGYTLPQDPNQFPVLTVWALRDRALSPQSHARSHEEETGRIERDYRDALKALDAVAAGNLSLGAGDPLLPSTEAAAAESIAIEGDERRFSRSILERI
jgi:phage gp36-like protein